MSHIITRRAALATGLAAGLAAPRAVRADDEVRLTMWTWVPNKREDLDLFEQAYPGIKVDLVNAGQGATTTPSCAQPCGPAAARPMCASPSST